MRGISFRVTGRTKLRDWPRNPLSAINIDIMCNTSTRSVSARAESRRETPPSYYTKFLSTAKVDRL